MRPKYLELWGYPGAGKSTTAKQLADEFGIPVPPYRPTKGLIPSLRALVGLVPFCNGTLAAYLPPESALKKRIRALNAMSCRQSDTVRNQAGPCVLVEGVTHELWRLLFRHPDQCALDWWHTVLRDPRRIVVLLAVSPDLAVERIKSKKSRGPINLELLQEDGDEPWERAISAFHAIHTQLERLPGALVTIDASGADSRSTCLEIIRLFESEAAAIKGFSRSVAGS